VPPYSQPEREPLTRRERNGVLAVVATLLVAGGALGVWAAGSSGGGNGTGHCVSVVVAGSTGGETLHHCGAGARAWCASEATATGEIADEVKAACRQAGLDH
jgi:hypothetical protein